MMSIIPTPSYPTSPRDDLIVDIMLLLDQATEGDEPVSTYELAKRIVDRVEPTPLDPSPASTGSTGALNPVLLAMVKGSPAKYAR